MPQIGDEHFWAVIPQYGRVQDTLECLESVLACAEVRALVVDNGSAPEELEILRQWARGELSVPVCYPRREPPLPPIPRPVPCGVCSGGEATDRRERLYILTLDQNRGYAAAINAGWRWLRSRISAETEAIVVLNNDTVLAPDFWPQLRALLDGEHPDAVLGPLVLDYRDGTDWQRPELRPPALWSWPLRAWAFRRRRARKDSIWYRRFWYTGLVSASVYMLPGSCWIFPRQVWLRLEELDEGTFLYWEEHILAERARRLGIEMRFEPRLRIYHKWSRTAQDNHWDAFVRSGMYYLRRYRGAGSLQIAGWRFLWSLQGIWRLLRRIGSSPLKSS
nr:MAG: hypothetical protein KatS3mg041_2017 [Bacteroidota bacterium]